MFPQLRVGVHTPQQQQHHLLALQQQHHQMQQQQQQQRITFASNVLNTPQQMMMSQQQHPSSDPQPQRYVHSAQLHASQHNSPHSAVFPSPASSDHGTISPHHQQQQQQQGQSTGRSGTPSVPTISAQFATLNTSSPLRGNSQSRLHISPTAGGSNGQGVMDAAKLEHQAQLQLQARLSPFKMGSGPAQPHDSYSNVNGVNSVNGAISLGGYGSTTSNSLDDGTSMSMNMTMNQPGSAGLGAPAGGDFSSMMDSFDPNTFANRGMSTDFASSSDPNMFAIGNLPPMEPPSHHRLDSMESHLVSLLITANRALVP